MRTAVCLNDLSSAVCDCSDVIASLRRRSRMDCLKEVIAFLSSISTDTEGVIEVEIDDVILQNCINQTKALVKSLDRKTLNSSKDDEDSSSTIEDCLVDILRFLKSL
jgi:hypothetical protein